MVILLFAALLFVIVLRACAGARTTDTTSPAKPSVPAASSTAPVPSGPSEQQKLRWEEIVLAESQSPAIRLSAAQNLIENFPNAPAGQQARQLLPELEKAAAYEAMGKQWSYNRSDEGMSGKAVVTTQVESSNAINLGFPYAGRQKGTLTLRRHPPWGNDVIFRIERGQILCHSYGDCRINVKFDDGKVMRFNGNPPEDNSSEVVFIPAFSTFTKQLPTAKRVKIEVSIYQAGNNVFDFDVSGFKPEKFK